MSINLRPAEAQAPGRAENASLIALWLLALTTLGACILLLPLLFDFVRHSLNALSFPWQIDIDEGLNANASWLLTQGVNIYRANPADHFISATHPPVFYLLNALAIKVWGLNLFSGRLLSLLGALAIAVLIWLWVYSETGRHMPGVLASLLWLVLTPVAAAATLYKPVMLATALGLGGLLLIRFWILDFGFWIAPKDGAANQRPLGEVSKLQDPKSKIQNPMWSVALLALAVWTDERALALVVVGGTFVLIHDRRAALRWWAAMAACIVLPAAALDLWTQGGFHRHLLAFRFYDRSLLEVVNNLFVSWNYYGPVALLGLGAVGLAIWNLVSRRQAPGLIVLYLVAATAAALWDLSNPTAVHDYMLGIFAPLCLLVGTGLGLAWRALGEPASITKAQENSTGRPSSDWGDWAVLGFGVLALVVLQLLMLMHNPPWTRYWPSEASLDERAPFMERLSALVRQTPGDVLSDDAWVLLAGGRRVLYDDRAAMAAMAGKNAWDQSTLVEDLNRRKYSLVIVQNDPSMDVFNARWSKDALAAFKANYRPRFTGMFFSYEPKPEDPAPQSPLGCSIEGGPVLDGITFRAATANRGDTLTLTLYWKAPGHLPASQEGQLKYFVHMVDMTGNTVWQADLAPGEPGGKPFPQGWAPNSEVSSSLPIPVGPSTPYGQYRLVFGAYTQAGEAILPVKVECARGTQDASGKVDLAGVRVVERWGN